MPVIRSYRAQQRYATQLKCRLSQNQPSFTYVASLALALLCLSAVAVAYSNAHGHAAGAGKGEVQKKASTAKGSEESVAAAKTRINKAYGQLPMSFEPNLGQVDLQVEYLSRGQGFTLFLTKGEAVLSLAAGKGKAATVRMKTVGANLNAEITGEEQQEGRSNYFTGKDPSKWQRDVLHFSKVRYRQVYPGIDLVYYGKQMQLEYDFVVAPGADPNQIKLRFDGVDRMKVDAAGDLVLKLRDGSELRQHRPVVYQEIVGVRRKVEGRFNVRGKREVGFELGDYDQSQPLVIDPLLVYSTFLGGDSNESGKGIAVDKDGNAYVIGETRSTDFPVTMGAFQTPYGGDLWDVFVTKLKADGSGLEFSTYLGGNSYEEAGGIAVDGSGCAYLTGRTSSFNFPTTAGAFQTIGKGFHDAFVIKLNADGSKPIYSTLIGGSQYEGGDGISIDKDGNAYLTGFTGSPNFPTTVGAIQKTLKGGTDAFVTKINTDGSALIHSTFLGGSENDYGNGIALDDDGNPYLTGEARSKDFRLSGNCRKSPNI